MSGLAQRAVESLIRRRALELGRCVKACFLDGNGIATREAECVIADMRKFAKLDGHSFLRDLTGKIDPIAMARIEGRREVANRLINFLELEPSEVRRFVEVDNGTE
jgi:hypothetical protein